MWAISLVLLNWSNISVSSLSWSVQFTWEWFIYSKLSRRFRFLRLMFGRNLLNLNKDWGIQVSLSLRYCANHRVDIMILCFITNSDVLSMVGFWVISFIETWGREISMKYLILKVVIIFKSFDLLLLELNISLLGPHSPYSLDYRTIYLASRNVSSSSNDIQWPIDWGELPCNYSYRTLSIYLL